MPSLRWILKLMCAAAVVLSRAWTQDTVVSQPQIWAARPDIASFEKLEDERLARAQQSINAVIAVRGARTIENTLVPYHEAILQLDNARNFASLIEAAHPDAVFRDRGTAMLRKVKAVVTSLSLKPDIFSFETHDYRGFEINGTSPEGQDVVVQLFDRTDRHWFTINIVGRGATLTQPEINRFINSFVTASSSSPNR